MRRCGNAAGVGTLALWAGLAACGCAPEAADKPRVLDDKVAYPEGAAYFGGKLYYVGYGDGTLNVWDGKQSRILWKEKEEDKGSGPCAVVPVGKDNDELLVACYLSNTLVRLSADGKQLDAVKVEGAQEEAGPNDFVKDADGGVYFSTSGKFDVKAKPTGRVYYRDSSGEIRCVAKDIHYANGLALTDGGKTLLVAATLDATILKYAVRKPGQLSETPDAWRRLDEIQKDPADVARDVKGYVGPDGLKTDSKGNVYTCQFGAGRVLVADKDGKWLRTVPVPYKYVTNVALNPDDESVVYVTAAKDGMNEKAAEAGGAVFEIPNR
jgi:sugar lactone lactonase YvrE